MKSITSNLHNLLQGAGIRFSHKTFDDLKAVPLSLIPFGQVFYEQENFENTHGQKATYIETDFLLKIILKEKDPALMINTQQKWVHLLRASVTVDALNTGDLASTKLVSRVDFSGVKIENKSIISLLNINVKIRYREL
ncbi:MAG: hypothetical protein KAT46_08035 [Deltaproteobacteria bacterium]|nr:hypothetical protein [Deltaproteobacteria bacterium]